jgi:hypothetical protein
MVFILLEILDGKGVKELRDGKRAGDLHHRRRDSRAGSITELPHNSMKVR